MGLWQSVSMRTVTGDMTDEVHSEVMAVVDQWADRSRELMIATSLVPHSSPLGRPFNLVLVAGCADRLARLDEIAGRHAYAHMFGSTQ